MLGLRASASARRLVVGGKCATLRHSVLANVPLPSLFSARALSLRCATPQRSPTATLAECKGAAWASVASARAFSTKTNGLGEVHERDFVSRHIGLSQEQTNSMLKAVGVDTMEQLIDGVIDPRVPRRAEPMASRERQSEAQVLNQVCVCACVYVRHGD